jgi:hypothetical protein
MNLIRIGLCALFIGVLSIQSAFAEVTGPKVSGFIDTTYNQDLSSPSRSTNFGRSFDLSANTFLLNAVQLNLDGSSGANGYHIEFHFGTDQKSASEHNIQEAYMTWSQMDGKCVITAGKFVTLEGIEVIESGANPTISRGYLFGLAEPYSHIGVKMDHKLNDKIQITLGAVNGWEIATDNNRDKTYLARVGLNWGNPLTVGIVHYIGNEETTITSGKRNSTDITGVSKWGNLAINFQYNMGKEEDLVAVGTDAEWSGFGIQPVYTVNDKFSVGARYESFEDTNGARGLGGAATPAKDAWNITLTPTWKLSDTTTLRAEYRMDDWTVTATGASEDSSTVGGEMIYTF